MGWTRVAREYQRITGQLVSRDTLERRYLKYKQLQSAGKLQINAISPPSKKKDEVHGAVEYEIMITRSPNSMK